MRPNISVVGMGYVGLPLAVAFDGAGFDVTGFDVSREVVEALDSGVDTTGEIGDARVENSELTFTDDPAAIGETEYVVIAVPTPVDASYRPDLSYVESAGETIGEHLRRDATVVLESTVYPGATEEILRPAIERTSGWTAGEDFYVGYSPERAVPGDREHGLDNVVKIVGGESEAVREDLAGLYESIVGAGVYRAPSIEVAEAAKCIENVQRDVNIALVNELAALFSNWDIDTHAVLEAAGTKWNFHQYRPGLVGGHCIPVDPYYLVDKANRDGYTADLIETARDVNNRVPGRLADMTLAALAERADLMGRAVGSMAATNECVLDGVSTNGGAEAGYERAAADGSLLVFGLAYKPNTDDVRSSAIEKCLTTLESAGVALTGYDPHVENAVIEARFGIDAQEELSFAGFDGVLIMTPHREIAEYSLEGIREALGEHPIVVDPHAVFRHEGKRSPHAHEYVTL
jgi:UDP-N-acetyl-D-galactosamine dehydrogenase